jgi:hypothetical protein
MAHTLGDRLKQFLAFKGHKVTHLAEELGYSNAEKLNRLFRDKDAKPGYDTIMDIANHYPDMNVEWFLKGVGEMIVTPTERTTPATVHNTGLPDDDAMISAIKNSKLSGDQKFEMALELLRVYADQIERLQNEMEIKNKLLLLGAEGKR